MSFKFQGWGPASTLGFCWTFIGFQVKEKLSWTTNQGIGEAEQIDEIECSNAAVKAQNPLAISFLPTPVPLLNENLPRLFEW